MYIGTRRDLAREIRDIVNDQLERIGDTYSAAQVAESVVHRLRENDPELLAKFMDQHALSIFTRMVGDIIRAERSHARAVSSRSVFAGAVQRHEAGEAGALAAWLDVMYVVTTDEQRRRLRDMDKADLEFAAADYTERSRANALQAAFLKALAAKVGAKTVGEMYTDEELTRMWISLA